MSTPLPDESRVRTILVIEDQDTLRRNVALLLEMEDFRVATAENGRLGRSLWFGLFCLMAVFLGGGAESVAQEISTVTELKAMEGARLNEKAPVRLRGVVVFSGRIGFVLHDGVASAQIVMAAAIPRPDPGTTMEVEGTTGIHPLVGRDYPVVNLTKLTTLGAASLPVPVPATLGEVARFKHWDQWVTTEGVVLDHSWSRGDHRLLLGGTDGWGKIHVRQTAREDFPRDFVGARVRVTGVNQGHDHSPNNAMMLSDPSKLEVLQPGPVDLFTVPEATIRDLRASGPSLDLVRVKGRVIHVTPDDGIFIRDDEGAACRFTNFLPLTKPTTKAGEASPVEPLPPMRPGDLVEAVGIAATVVPGLWLRFCHGRVIESGNGEPPAAVQATLIDVAKGGQVNHLVRLQGHLVEKHGIPLRVGRYRHLLTIENGGASLRAVLEASPGDSLEHLKADDLVQLDGIVMGPSNGEPLRLVLRKAEDAVSLGTAPAAWLRRLWIWGGLAAAVIALLGAWGMSLRRSIARSEAAEASVRALNTTLEDRVSERTAELEQARLDLDAALAEERDVNQLKSRFVAMVSHEFRTPLGVTMSALELLRHHLDRLPKDKVTELLDDIFSSTLRMSGLMEQVLLLGRVEEGKVAFRPAPVDLEELCGKLIVESKSATHRREPVGFAAEGDLASVRVDEGLVRHILGNLLSNAVKYSPPGSPINFRVRRDGEAAEFTVVDQGIGIPEADRGRLFDAFYRASNVGDISGTGLGLLLVKRCVEIHGGGITFDSGAGRGTTFTVRLPFGRGAA